MAAQDNMLADKDVESSEASPRLDKNRSWSTATLILGLILLISSLSIFAVYHKSRFVRFPGPELTGFTEENIVHAGIHPDLKRQMTIYLHPEEHSSHEPETRYFLWNITKATVAPDGVEKEVFLINGRSIDSDLMEYLINKFRSISWSSD